MSFTSSIWFSAVLSGTICISTCNLGYSQTKQDPISRNNNSALEKTDSEAGFRYSYKTASPKAQKLMKEDFFWSPIEETAPFGSDDGSDAAYGFYQWRRDHKHDNPMDYLNDLLAGWNYPYFDRNELDTVKIKNYLSKEPVYDDSTLLAMKTSFKNLPPQEGKELSDSEVNQANKAGSKSMGITFLTGIDEATIATGFAQLVLEGLISPELKNLTAIAIQRQLLPLLLTRYSVNCQKIRKYQLTKMLSVIRHCDQNT